MPQCVELRVIFYFQKKYKFESVLLTEVAADHIVYFLQRQTLSGIEASPKSVAIKQLQLPRKFVLRVEKEPHWTFNHRSVRTREIDP